MIKLLLLVVVGLSSVFSVPTTDDNELTEVKEVLDCHGIFADNGMNYSSFHEGAGHGAHSLSLEEIRYFFDKDATEENNIATVNIDFRSDNIIHLHAPLWGYEDRFDTWALKIMDWFMLNDQPYLYTNKMNTLEKIGHQYHMHEIYSRAADLYQLLVQNPPPSNVCKCARDFTRNGILDEMVNIARTLKYFGSNRQRRALSGDDLKKYKFKHYNQQRQSDEEQIREKRSGDDLKKYKFKHYNKERQSDEKQMREKRSPDDLKKYKFKHYNQQRQSGEEQIREKRSVGEEEAKDVEQLKQAYLDNSNTETANRIVESEEGWHPNTLTGPDYEQWIPFSAMLTYSLPDQEALNDFTHYIYCMLNHNH